MALADTFSSDFLNPFKSKFTCLNNFQSGRLEFQRNQSTAPQYKFNWVLTHPTHVQDFFVTADISANATASGVAGFWAYDNQVDIAIFAQRFHSLEFSINSTQLNTNIGFNGGLSQYFLPPDVFKYSAEERRPFGELYADYISFGSAAKTNVRQELARKASLRKHVAQRRTTIIPLGALCNFFAQDTVLPDNTEITLKFSVLTTPGFNLNFALNRTDNFVHTNTGVLDYGMDFLSNSILCGVYNRLVSKRAFPYAETAFSCHWREFIPLYTKKLLFAPDYSLARTTHYVVSEVLSYPLNQLPEVLLLWIQNYTFIPIRSSTTLGRALTSTTYSSLVTATHYSMVSGVESPSLDLDNNYFYISALRIKINDEIIFDYDYELSKLPLDFYLQDNRMFEDDKNLPINQLFRYSPYIIHLQKGFFKKNQISVLSAGLLTIEYVINRVSNSFTFTSPPPTFTFCIFASQVVKTSVDAYRRTWQD